jgi:hypothetical protein
MNYKMLCTICATPADKNDCCCSGCGSMREPVFVCELLLKAVEMLIKMGIGVTNTDSRYCTTHKTKVTIVLAEDVPKHIFDNLLDDWVLHHLGNVYYLRCNNENPASSVKELEEWLKNKRHLEG